MLWTCRWYTCQLQQVCWSRFPCVHWQFHLHSYYKHLARASVLNFNNNNIKKKLKPFLRKLFCCCFWSSTFFSSLNTWRVYYEFQVSKVKAVWKKQKNTRNCQLIHWSSWMFEMVWNWHWMPLLEWCTERNVRWIKYNWNLNHSSLPVFTSIKLRKL